VGMACLLALSAGGCGSTRRVPAAAAHAPTPFERLTTCLQKSGYAVTPESVASVHTAPRRFEFTAVWNLLNPSRVALAMTFSRTTTGAKEAAAWTRATNAKVGRGLVPAPVARIGKIDVLWTATPGARSTNDVYGCIRSQA
jgi:hypothetical protein